jgi:hypothetical protein
MATGDRYTDALAGSYGVGDVEDTGAGLAPNGVTKGTRHVTVDGGSVQFGQVPVVTHGLAQAATQQEQIVQLPDIPCRKVVVAYPKQGIPEAALPNAYGNSGTGNAAGRYLFYGDAAGQFWALDMGDVEELEVSNANQVFLRDPNFDWVGFNTDSGDFTNAATGYVLVAYWRVIK